MNKLYENENGRRVCGSPWHDSSRCPTCQVQRMAEDKLVRCGCGALLLPRDRAEHVCMPARVELGPGTGTGTGPYPQRRGAGGLDLR